MWEGPLPHASTLLSTTWLLTATLSSVGQMWATMLEGKTFPLQNCSQSAAYKTVACIVSAFWVHLDMSSRQAAERGTLLPPNACLCAHASIRNSNLGFRV